MYEPLLLKKMTVQLNMMQMLCHGTCPMLLWLEKYLMQAIQFTRFGILKNLVCASSSTVLYCIASGKQHRYCSLLIVLKN